MKAANGTKICNRCHKEKAVAENFHKNRSTPDGYNYACKTCAIQIVTAAQRKHPETRRRGQQRYERSTKGIARQYRKRARRKGLALVDFTAEEWAIMLEFHRYYCVYCGRKRKRLTPDHLTPVVQQGPHTKANILPACRSCNSKKRDRAVLRPVQPVLLLPLRRTV